jgi:hypothetical protein
LQQGSRKASSGQPEMELMMYISQAHFAHRWSLYDVHCLQMRGIPAYIVVPKDTPQCKVDAVESYGGES